MGRRKTSAVKAEHLIVLRALEVVNLAHSRAASVHEVVAALLPEHSTLLQHVYRRSLTLAVSSVLHQLLHRQVVFSPGANGSKRYYGSARVLAQDKAPLPDIRSCR